MVPNVAGTSRNADTVNRSVVRPDGDSTSEAKVRNRRTVRAPTVSGRAFARIITGLREDRGLSCYRLAKELGLTTQAVVNLESGRITSPSWDTVQALADFFSVPLDTFRTRQSS